MKLTIIPSDGAVYKDGISFNGLDISSAPADVHALQFNTTSNAGWIEFVDNNNGTKPQNEPITSLPDWANICLTKWDEAKAVKETVIEGAKLAAEEFARLKAEEAAIAQAAASQPQTQERAQ